MPQRAVSIYVKMPNKMNCGNGRTGFVSPGCQGPWRFGKRTPPGLDRSNGSLSELAADSLAALLTPPSVCSGDSSQDLTDEPMTNSAVGKAYETDYFSDGVWIFLTASRNRKTRRHEARRVFEIVLEKMSLTQLLPSCHPHPPR
jgi:hypothetical protein